VFYRRKDFIEAGMWNESMQYLEDWELYIRMVERKLPMIYIAQPLYRYIWREGSMITRRRAMLNYSERIYSMHHKRMADSGDREAGSIYADNMWRLGREYLRDLGDWRRAATCCVRSMEYEISILRLLHPLWYWSRRVLQSHGNIRA
jgi:hypothetical protein